ncbi:ABC transporter substrate-binding protein [Jatrophihabitans sp. DSM 45814]
MSAQRKLRKRLIAVGAVAIATAMVAGCSSSGSGTDAGQAAAPTEVSASNLTKAPLVVGSISSDTGISGTGNAIPLTLRNWQNYVNANGGVNGHPVKVISKDDAGDPAKSITAVKSLVGDDHIIALLNFSNLGDSWGSYVAQQKVPVLDASASIGFHYAKDANFFPTGTTVLSVVWGQTYAAKVAGAKSFGEFYCAEQAACAQAVPLVKGYATQNGLTFATAEAFSASAPDYTAQCLAMKNAKADAVELAGSGTRIVDACAKQGYKPIWIVSSGSFNSAMRENANFDGTAGNIGSFPWFLDVPATQEFRTAMKQYLPDFNGIDSLADMSGIWEAAKVFQKAAANVSDTPTSSDIYTGLYSFKGETLGGLAPPLTYVQGKPSVVPCFFLIGVKDKAFVSSTGLKTSCQDDKGASGAS